MKKNSFSLFGTLVGLLLTVESAFALDVTINGFGSFYGIKPLQGDTYQHYPEETRGKLTFTEGTLMGINLRSDLGEGWSFISQVLASGARYSTDQEPDWKLTADWYYAVYNPIEGLNFRVGRQIFPTWLLSEFIDVGFTYPWRRPSPLVYSTTVFKSFNGLSADYRFKLANEMSLSASVFGGNDKNTYVWGQNNVSSTIEVDELLGATFTLDGRGWRVRASGSTYKIFDKETFTLEGAPAMSFNQKYEADILAYTLGGRYDENNIVLYAEYAAVKGRNGTIVPATGIEALKSSEGIYASLGYRFGKFLPWYMAAYGDWNYGFIGSNGMAQTHSVGLNYQAAESVVAKIQVDQVQSIGGDVLIMNKAGQGDTLSFGVDVVF